MSNKTTAANFKYFESRVRYWINKFRLGGWEIDVVHKDLIDNLAETAFNQEARHAAIRLGVEWGDWPVNQKSLDSTARHEVLEVVLFDIGEMAERLGASQSIMQNLTHSVIHHIESALS